MASYPHERRIIQRAARSAGIDPAILWGVYGAESNFGRNRNNSSAGAQGPFQFMPGTAAGMGIDPHNFRQAAFGAAKYLAQYKSRGTAGMLAAYNAGPGGNPNNPETQNYIRKVPQLGKTWEGARGGGGGGAPQTQGLTRPQVAAQAAYAAGFRGQDLVNMVAIAGRESRYRPGAHNLGPRDDSYGLWQINVLPNANPKYKGWNLKDPFVNAKAAHELFTAAGYKPWVGVGYGNARQFLPRARRAVAAVRRGGVQNAASGAAQAPSQAILQAAQPATLPETSPGIQSLLSDLVTHPRVPVSSGVAGPSFAAHPVMSGGAPQIASGGGPAPRPSIDSLLSAVQTPPQQVQHAPAVQALLAGQPVSPQQATAIRGSAGAAPAVGRAPLRGAKPGNPVLGGRSGGGNHGTSGLPGYSGVDYFAKPGTTAVAPVSGKVVRFSGHDPKLGAVEGAGGPLGWSVYIQGSDGRSYYLTHMGSRSVKVGQRVKQGQPIGTVANYDKYGRPSHIHMGIKP